VVAASDAYLAVNQITRADVIGREIFTIAGDGQGAAAAPAVAELRKSLARVLRDGIADAVNVPVVDRGRVICIIHRPEQIAGPVPPQPVIPLNQAAAEQAQAAFASRVSRELRAPLSTILGFAELLALGDLSEDQRDKAWVVVRAARRLETVLNDILDISRTEDTELSVSVEAVPAAQVVAGALELIRPLAASHGVHLDQAPASGLYLQADQQRLRQVLLNLLSNSVKYNHPGGKVAVSITSRPGNMVRITVTDTGRGIAGPDLARLFTPFERLDAAAAGIEGTGLGLALCQRLVKAMGGQTGVASTQGLGSAFWVDLPAAQPAQRPAEGATRSPAGVRAYPAPKTLLYVEDMVENLRLVEQILRKRPSVRLVPAMLGGVALDLATEHHPDLILLDLHLPDIAGEELLRRFQADPATSAVPVVVLSADAAEAQITRLLAAGAAAYVTKPIGVRSFLETVDRLIGQAATATAGATPAAVDDRHDAG
jgi:signal transduction histidine kinase/CheY-like chemotaxis protein